MHRVLIETLWNVKQCHLTTAEGRTTVLIETLWNVKKRSINAFISIKLVLIETLWNVKMITGDFINRTRGINRNIVECKDSI